MKQLFEASLAYPTVVFTVLLGVAVVYWLVMIVGGLEMGKDVHGPDAGDGGDIGDGGAGDGGAADHAGHDHAGDGSGGAGGILAALGLRKVPLTISVSLLSLFGWVICISITTILGSGGFGLPGWLLGSLVLLAALVLALPPTSVMARMLAPLFATHPAKKRADYVGTICTITTGKVTADFGQARIEDGGDMLIVQVRCDKGSRFARNDRALVIDFDQAREAYLIEPVDALLDQQNQSRKS